jgi:hypothetical protein
MLLHHNLEGSFVVSIPQSSPTLASFHEGLVEKWIYQDLGSACVGEGSIYPYPFTATLKRIRFTGRLTVKRVGKLIDRFIDGLIDGLWVGSDHPWHHRLAGRSALSDGSVLRIVQWRRIFAPFNLRRSLLRYHIV